MIFRARNGSTLNSSKAAVVFVQRTIASHSSLVIAARLELWDGVAILKESQKDKLIRDMTGP